MVRRLRGLVDLTRLVRNDDDIAPVLAEIARTVSESARFGTVAVNVPDALLVARTLKARNFLVDYRPPVGVRMSPHFYNTPDEVDRIMSEMASIVATRNYEGAAAQSRVT